MAGLSSHTASPLPNNGDGSSGTPPPRLPRGWWTRLIGLAGLAVIALAAAALIPGSHQSGTRPFGVNVRAAASDPVNPLGIRVTKVFGSDIPARQYGTEIGRQENQGVDAQGQLASDLSPLPPRYFNGPFAVYRHYAEHWSVKLGRAVDALRSGLAANNRGAAKREWATAFADYLHLGAVYNLLPTPLDHRLAAVPTNLADPHFSGLHRIELGLWTGAAPRSLVPVATAISHAVVTLRRILPSVAMDPLDYAARAHEILEDAQRDLMSGADVPWSGAGVLGTEAGVIATKEVISTLVPLLQGRDNTLAEVQSGLVQLQNTMNSVRRSDGSWPSLDQLTMTQRERINGTITGALTALALVPGTLETQDIPRIPTIASQETK